MDSAGDAVDYYKDNFGDDQFNDIVKNNDLIDKDALREYVKSIDGIAFSLSRDGYEHEYNGIYYYKT